MNVKKKLLRLLDHLDRSFDIPESKKSRRVDRKNKPPFLALGQEQWDGPLEMSVVQRLGDIICPSRGGHSPPGSIACYPPTKSEIFTEWRPGDGPYGEFFIRYDLFFQNHARAFQKCAIRVELSLR
jgi:hypothetical protein